jgi:iron complex outermembrane receptor protein
MKSNYLFKKIILATILILNFLFASANGEIGNNGSIAGYVKTSDGKPAASVKILIEGLNKSAITTEEGSFIFKNIKPGNYILSVIYFGKLIEQKTVIVYEKETTNIVFDLTENLAQLNEVVVASSQTVNNKNISIGKMKVAAMDLPQSAVVIDKTVLEQQQSLRLSDAIRNINGVYLYSTRGNTQETFAARGYSFSSTNMFKNNFRVNSGAMPEISSLEKIEILKGSAALLYGNVAAGGVLNMVTKKPKFESGGQASLTYGSFDLYKPTFDVYRPISKKIAYRLNGTYENANSYRDNVKTNRYYINPSVLYQINTKTNIIVEGDYLNHDFTPDFGTGQINNVIADVPRNRYLGPIWSKGNTKQTTATATINHQINSLWQLSGGLSYQYFDREFQTTDKVLPNATGDWNRTLNNAKTLESYYTGQFNITGQFNTGKIEHNILFGMDADKYENKNYTYVATIKNNKIDPTGVSSYLDNNNQFQSVIYDKINIFDLNKFVRKTDKPNLNPLYNILTPTDRFGAYFNDLISVTKKIKILAGVRWTYQYISSTIVDANYSPDVSVSSAKGRQDIAFSPRGGIVYKPIENTSLFASYSNSFAPNTGIDVNNQPLKPSIIDQYEAGVKNDFLNGKLSVNFTAYQIFNNNLAQTATFLADGTPNTNTNLKELVGKTKSEGVELDISGHPAKGLDLLAGYSFTNARYTETPLTLNSNISGEPLLNVPRHTANASLFYTFCDRKLKGFKMGVSAFYLGKRIAGNSNTNGQSQTLSRLVSVNGFTTVDATFGYGFKKLNILAKISNIGNVLNYNVHENYSINPIPPRQFLTTLTYRF